MTIEVDKIIDPIPASDGAGVKLKRSIGIEPNYFDPFLMLDEFGSENSEDYIAGFPPHPHRGIETCLLYTSPSPRDRTRSRMPSSA